MQRTSPFMSRGSRSAATIDFSMISRQLPNPLKKIQKLSEPQFKIPDNETARLLILRQTKILDSDRNDVEYDRFTSLAQRILGVPYAFLTFIDFDRQWLKSDVGISVTNPNVERTSSIDARAMFPDAPEVVFIPDISEDETCERQRDPFGLDDESIVLRFYCGAVISVDGFRVGVLSVADTKPRSEMSLNDRQNLFDLAAAVSNLVRERRQRHLRFRKERANLMLGLNHNLRTPLMSLTLVTEMLRNEIKQLAMAKAIIASSKRDDASRSQSPAASHLALSSLLPSENCLLESAYRSSHLASRNLSRVSSESSLNELSSRGDSGQSSIGLGSAAKHSRSTSRQYTPDVPCMNLMGDLQGSLQQLSLLVEMGLVLGKITSGMAVLADGTYDSMLCDVLKVYEKVQTLTQRMGRSQNVLWNIDRRKLSKGKQYSHPDVLMFVLISALTQFIPHSDMIKVKATFVPVEEVSRLVDDQNTLRTLAAMADVISPPVVVGRVGILMTELEAFGDPNNLKEIVAKLHVTSEESEASKSGGSTSESSGDVVDPSPFLDPDIEEFGGSIFALGNLLENVMGGSSYVLKNHGCVFSFSIPMRIENDNTVPISPATKGEEKATASEIQHHHLATIPSMVGDEIGSAKSDVRSEKENDRKADTLDDSCDSSSTMGEIDLNADENFDLSEESSSKKLRPTKITFNEDVSVHIVDADDADTRIDRSHESTKSAISVSGADDTASKSSDGSTEVVVYTKEPVLMAQPSALSLIRESTVPLKRDSVRIINVADLVAPPLTAPLVPPLSSDKGFVNAVGGDSSTSQMKASESAAPSASQTVTDRIPSEEKDTSGHQFTDEAFAALKPASSVSCQQASKADIVMSLRDMINGDIPTHLRPLRVLMVDDSLTVQKVMGIWLSKKNCVVTQALNGQVALDLMKETAYDIVFMDFLMPVMDGLTCMRLYNEFIQTAPAYQRPTGYDHQWIIGLSATAIAADLKQAFEVNMHMFCPKPVDMNAMSYVLEAKRSGLNYDVLRDIAVANRAETLSAGQKTGICQIMVPDSTNDAQVTADRDRMRSKIDKNFTGNIFGSFTFSL